MRILHVLRAPVGGLFRHVLDLAAEQAARGHEVGILADSNVEDRLTAQKFATLAPHLKIGIIRVPMSRQPGVGDFDAYRSVFAHTRPLNLDVLHGHGSKGGVYTRLSARQLRKGGQAVKAFYTPHGGSLNYRPGSVQSTIFLKIERVLENYSDGLIFESAYAARVYADRVGHGDTPQRIIPNGLQPADFELQKLETGASDFLFIGELRTIKGIDILLEALAHVRKESAVTATIVGSGPDQERLVGLSNQLGLTKTIKFTGALPARQAFGLGRIMVVPSLAESFPYVVLEAAAAQIPLISTDVGGIREIVAETDTTLIRPGNAASLAAAMRDALDDPAGALAKAQRLRSNVKAKFTVAGMTSAILDFYAAARR